MVGWSRRNSQLRHVERGRCLVRVAGAVGGSAGRPSYMVSGKAFWVVGGPGADLSKRTMPCAQKDPANYSSTSCPKELR